MDNGFSLVELMIVLLITAVLAAISIPAYQHHLIAAHRREAASELLQGALSLETTYQRTHRYDNASLSSINLNSTEYYDFKLNTTAHTFTLRAIPNTEDTQCGTLSITQSGEQGYTGTASSSRECW